MTKTKPCAARRMPHTASEAANLSRNRRANPFFDEKNRKSLCLFCGMEYIVSCQQLRMGIRLFPCCLIALLTCKNSAPFCPAEDGKIPRFDPFKGDFGVCIKSLVSALKSQNGSKLQLFLSKNDVCPAFPRRAPFSASNTANLPHFVPMKFYSFKKLRIPSKIILAAMAERNKPVRRVMTEIVVLLMTFSDQTPIESTPAKTMIPTSSAPILEQ